MQFEDGTGNGHSAKVDSNNMLHTRSVSTPANLYAGLGGDSFNIPWASFTLTTATASALSYFAWTDTTKVAVLSRQIFSFGPSTGGTGLVRVRIVRNPTGGTIISGGTAVTAVNTNFGSGAVPNATFLKGAQGSTITGGTTVIDIGMPASYFAAVGDIDWIISNGSSYAVEITPPAGNTSMVVYLMDKMYRLDAETVT